MKKIIAVVLFCLVGCAPIQTSTLQGKIAEVDSHSLLIDNQEHGLIEVSYDAAIDYQIGDTIEISYRGGIKETSPAQIDANEIDLIKEAPAYLEIIGVQDNELSFHFMSQKTYYYLFIGAQIDYLQDGEWINCPFTSAGCGVMDRTDNQAVKLLLELYELKGSGKYRLTYTLYDESEKPVVDVMNYFYM